MSSQIISKIDWEGSKNSLMVSLYREFPKFKIRFKNESTFMKIVGFFMFFSSGFMTRVTTTINQTVYFPSRDFFESRPKQVFFILLHEREHLRQARRNTFPVFALGYLFPQCLSLLVLLSPISLWFLLSLSFLLPWPAPFRYRWEKEGYRWNILLRILFHHELSTEEWLHIRNNLSGPKYYFMHWEKVSAEEWVNNCMNDCIIGLYRDDEEYVKKLLRYEE